MTPEEAARHYVPPCADDSRPFETTRERYADQKRLSFVAGAAWQREQDAEEERDALAAKLDQVRAALLDDTTGDDDE